MDHPLPWLRYVDASDIDDNTIEFDGMNVKSPSGDKLGDVDGFIVDSESGRPYYVVVDAGGDPRHYFFPRMDRWPSGERPPARIIAAYSSGVMSVIELTAFCVVQPSVLLSLTRK